MTQPTTNGSPSQLPWTTSGSTTLTQAHNHPGGNFITIDIQACDSAARTLNSLTYGGVACTRIVDACDVVNLGGANNEVERWYIATSSTGSQNVVATFSGSVLGSMTIQSWNDVDTSSPIAQADFASALTSTPAPSVTLTPTANDQMLATVISIGTNSTGDTTISAGTAIGSVVRDAVFSATSASHARNSSGSTITFGLANSSGYGMGYYVLQGTGGGGGTTNPVERLVWMN